MNPPPDRQITVDEPIRPDASRTTIDELADLKSTGGSRFSGSIRDGGLQAVPGFRVLRELAHGGMGRVLAAHDLTLERDVAIKVLLPRGCRSLRSRVQDHGPLAASRNSSRAYTRHVGRWMTLLGDEAHWRRDALCGNEIGRSTAALAGLRTGLSSRRLRAQSRRHSPRSETIQVRAAFPGKNMYVVADVLRALGRARIALSKTPADFAVAEAKLLEAHDIFVKTRGPTSKEVRDCAKTVSEAYTAWDKAEPGKGYDVKAAEWKAKIDVDRK